MAVGRYACFIVAFATLSAPALAQPPSRPAAQASRAERWTDHHAERDARRQVGDQQRAADMALLLRLNPDQQAAYRAMDASMRSAWSEHAEHTSEHGADAAPMTTTQALDRVQARMSEHQARARAHLDATRRFYAALSPEQQGLFDALVRLRHGAGEGGRGRGRDGPPMMHGDRPPMVGDMGPRPSPPGV